MTFTQSDLYALELACIHAREATLHARNAALWERAKSHVDGAPDLMDEHAVNTGELRGLRDHIKFLEDQIKKGQP
jgi:hypothetical protein